MINEQLGLNLCSVRWIAIILLMQLANFGAVCEKTLCPDAVHKLRAVILNCMTFQQRISCLSADMTRQLANKTATFVYQVLLFCRRWVDWHQFISTATSFCSWCVVIVWYYKGAYWHGFHEGSNNWVCSIWLDSMTVLCFIAFHKTGMTTDVALALTGRSNGLV